MAKVSSCAINLHNTKQKKRPIISLILFYLSHAASISRFERQPDAENATTRYALRQAMDWLGWSYSGIHN